MRITKRSKKVPVFIGNGDCDHKDFEVTLRQARESTLRSKLLREYGVPLSRTYTMCEARLEDLYAIHERFDLSRHLEKYANENHQPSTVYIASTDGRIL